MAATRIIEEERGTFVGFTHVHNGYYAGDFGRRDEWRAFVPHSHPVVPTPALPFAERPPRGLPGRPRVA